MEVSNVFSTAQPAAPPPSSRKDSASAEIQKGRTPTTWFGTRQAIGFLDPYSSALPFVGNDARALDYILVAAGAYAGWTYVPQLVTSRVVADWERLAISLIVAITGHGVGRELITALEIFKSH